MFTIRLDGLSFGYDSEPLFSDLQLLFPVGFSSIVGENGSGKTTLLRLIAQELVPSTGRVVRPMRAQTALCPQDVDDAPDGLDDLAPTKSSARLFSQLELDQPRLSSAAWSALSQGERKRWQLFAALAREPDVLLLDEPTNHVDARCRALLLGALRNFSGIGVVISHDREVLNDLCKTQTVQLWGRRARSFPGPYKAARAAWTDEDASRQRNAERARREARRAQKQLDDMRRSHTAADAKRSAKRRMKSPQDSDARSASAKARSAKGEASLGQRVGVLRDRAHRTAIERQTAQQRLGPKKLGRSLNTVGADTSRRFVCRWTASSDLLTPDGRLVAKAGCYALRAGERVHIAGPNGAGKSTLMRRLVNAARDDDGDRRLLHLQQELSPAERRATRRALDDLSADEQAHVFHVVAALGSDPKRILRSSCLSPGEARKVKLAIGLKSGLESLFLDEPTNHLDLPSLERLTELLEDFPGTLVIITHDGDFASSLTNDSWSLPLGLDAG